MDIVRANIEKLNGTIAIESIVGHGTTVTVRLPLTLAIISALLIEVANQIYAIPLGAVHEALRLSPPEIKSIQHQEAILLRGRVLPLMRLRHFFRLLTAEPDTPSDVFIVAVRCGTHDIGLMVDRLIGEQEIVIKPLGRLIGDTPGISGATILGDGGVALILDLPGLVKAA
jgi:two-component system chemotaxis sensor kinase CheA